MGQPKPRIETPTTADAFKLFISDDMINQIINFPHDSLSFTICTKDTTWKPITNIEFIGFLGLLLKAGVNKSWDVPIRELFLDPECDPIYSATMSVNRFEDIRRFLGFDDKRTRDVHYLLTSLHCLVTSGLCFRETFF